MLMNKAETQPPTFERVHNVMHSPVRMKDGSYMSAADLAQRFYDSEIGLSMPDQPLRYTGNFGYDREDMRNDIGHDLCPIGHQMELVYHLGNILDAEDEASSLYSSISNERRGIVSFAVMTHDIGEAMHPSIEKAGLTVVGDIPAGKKTPADRRNETAVRMFLYETCFADVDDSVMDRIEAIIAHQDTSVLHELFEAAHQVQTIETSNFAYHALSREYWYANGETIQLSNDDGARLSGLLGMSRVVLERQLQDAESLIHLSHVRHVIDKARMLREPEHRLLNSLYAAH